MISPAKSMAYAVRWGLVRAWLWGLELMAMGACSDDGPINKVGGGGW